MSANEQKADNWYSLPKSYTSQVTLVHMIGIDFIGPIRPRGNDGTEYILTVSDYFTKWAEATTTCDKSAASVASALFKVILEFYY